MTFAAGDLLVMLSGDVDAERLVIVVPAVENRGVRTRVADHVVVVEADRTADRVGRHVEWLDRVHEHAAAEAAFRQARFGAVVDLQRTENFRRQQRVVEATVRAVAEQPDRLRHRMAIE
jgi:hypothetical protein